MKHGKLLLVAAFVVGGFGVANAQSSDSRTFVDEDKEKLEALQHVKLTDPAEKAKAAAYDAKIQKTKEFHGMVNIPDWDYDPTLSHEANVAAYKLAAEKLKMRNFAKYQELGLDQ